MKRPSLLSISIFVNIFIMFCFVLKSNLHQESFVLSHQAITETVGELGENTKSNKYSIQSRLDKMKIYKKPINTGIDHILTNAQETISIIKDIASEMNHCKNERLRKDLFKDEQRQNKIKQLLKVFAYDCKVIYRKTIEDLQADNLLIDTKILTAQDHNELLTLDVDKRLFMLRNCSRLDAQMILQSFLLDIRNLESIYTQHIINFFPNENTPPYSPKLVAHSKQAATKLGDTIEVNIQVGAYLDKRDDTVIQINDKEYYPDENGIVHFSEIPKKKGANKLKFRSKVINPLTGERYSSSSEYEYMVID